jgi:TonB family protein
MPADPAPAKLQTAGDSFGAVAAGTPQADSKPRSSTAAGFESASVAAGSSSRRPVAGSGGFGAVSANENAAPLSAPKPLAGAGFGAAVAANPVRQAAASRQKPEPLEIEYKPRPVYSEQGRQARIEGDVVLEVLFPASGSLRVLRVVHGLGYGLDENAIEAAGKIRFRPARQNGRPVDTVATVKITFQLAY